MLPEVGRLVRVRSRRHVVEAVVPPPNPGDDTRVLLRAIDDDALGERLEVLWEHEVEASLLPPPSWHDLAGRHPDAPRAFAAYLDALRWSCVNATSPKLLHAPLRAGIEVMPYQLEPLRRALATPSVRLFIADDAGLGKTIEAALIVRELALRNRVNRVVVVCPASVVLQWQAELDARFGMRFVVYDRAFFTETRRTRGHAANPFGTHTRFIVSHALLRDDAHVALLRDWMLAGEGPSSAVLVLDEAHAAVPAKGAGYAADSRLFQRLREVAPLFEHRLFLSATPEAGRAGGLAALLELLDPPSFRRGEPVSTAELERVMVRRQRSELAEVGVGFPSREVVPVEVEEPNDAPELVLGGLLEAYRAAREAKLEGASPRARAAAMAVLAALQRRLLSSVDAFAAALAVHRATVLGARGARRGADDVDAAAALEAPDADDPRAELGDDDAQAEADAAVDAATRATAAVAAFDEEERALLDKMWRIAEGSRGRDDARTARLLRWIQGACLEGDRRTWTARRVIVFTEFAETQRHVARRLRGGLEGTHLGDQRVESFHAGLGDARRDEVIRAFQRRPDAAPLRVLVATDAAREGVNLQGHCADLFHFDVPWRTSRIEQRHGRIDRTLQRAATVRFHHFASRARPEDRVLGALVAAASRPGGGDIDGLLEQGIPRSCAPELCARLARPSSSTAASRSAATTRQELEGLADMMGSARDALGLDPASLRASVDAALALSGAGPLLAGERPGTFRFPMPPAFQAEPAWIEALDALREPRARDEDVRAWQKRATLRPVRFDSAGGVDDDEVPLFLDHRLVQRLLARLAAQGTTRDELARVTVVLADDTTPRVALLGRLSLRGERGSRLHDELLAITAPWAPPDFRGGALRPDEGDARARAALGARAALRAGRAAPADVAKILLASATRDVDELGPALAAIAAEREAAAVELHAVTSRRLEPVGLLYTWPAARVVERERRAPT